MEQSLQKRLILIGHQNAHHLAKLNKMKTLHFNILIAYSQMQRIEANIPPEVEREGIVFLLFHFFNYF